MKKEKIIFIISLVMMIFSTSVSVYATSCLYNSSDVSYTAPTGSVLSANVQDSLTEVYGHCTDYTSMDTRVSSLEGHFQNNSTSYFDGNYLNLTGSGTESGVVIQDSTGTNRGALVYNSTVNVTSLDARNSAGSYGTGTLSLRGNPVTINGKEVNSLPKLETVVNNKSYSTSASYQAVTTFECTENSLISIVAPWQGNMVQGVKLTATSNNSLLYLNEYNGDHSGDLYFCNHNNNVTVNIKNNAAGYTNKITIKKITF